MIRLSALKLSESMKQFTEFSADELGVPIRSTAIKRAELKRLMEVQALKALVSVFQQELKKSLNNVITLRHQNIDFNYQTDGISEHFCKLLRDAGWVVSHSFNNSDDNCDYCHSISVHVLIDRDKQKGKLDERFTNITNI